MNSELLKIKEGNSFLVTEHSSVFCGEVGIIKQVGFNDHTLRGRNGDFIFSLEFHDDYPNDTDNNSYTSSCSFSEDWGVTVLPVGTHVRLDLYNSEETNILINSKMKEFHNCVAEIVSIHYSARFDQATYCLDIDEGKYNWTLAMFKEVVSDNQEEESKDKMFYKESIDMQYVKEEFNLVLQDLFHATNAEPENQFRIEHIFSTSFYLEAEDYYIEAILLEWSDGVMTGRVAHNSEEAHKCHEKAHDYIADMTMKRISDYAMKQCYLNQEWQKEQEVNKEELDDVF